MMNKLWSFLFLLGFSILMIVAGLEDEESNCFALRDEACPNANITFWLYTKEKPEGLEISPFSIPVLEFLPMKSLKVLIHGFNGHRNYTPNVQLRPRFIKLDINVISLDFQKLANEPCYSEAVHNAKYVGRCIAQLLRLLLESKLVANKDVHLIGLGLGAHVAGFVGQFMPEHKLEHITALDPAKPLYLVNDTAQKLDPTDAKFVDVVHTDVLMLGLLEAVGHVDFYLNMGVEQPNCGPVNQMETHFCYHNRAADYYAESISSNAGFYGFYCPNYKSFATGACVPKKDIEPMGFYAHPEARGRYFLETNNGPPYAKGTNYKNINRQLKGRTFMNDELIDQLFENKADA
ncbi:inactive pancreatic lipase-related protein 1 [Drosophila takahashii]|uniref:inactive pancreatic lipase-related protein 1 n=1 Tax=Drosophila takahashii TaxID=29030 RepID=UPI001CF895D1|nr:inactive pancreatic lipase-related protein 1 [Drosophila takahashii]